MSPPTVFVSYSHQDGAWKDLLLPQLQVLVRLELIDLWVDQRIDAGDSWYPEIRAALEKAAAAVCLISAHYLSSVFVSKEEVPYFLEQREKRGLLLLPVLVSECPWRLVDWIKAIQMVPRGAKPLDSLADAEKNAVLSALAEQLAAKLGRTGAKRDDPTQPSPNLIETLAPSRGKRPATRRGSRRALEYGGPQPIARELLVEVAASTGGLAASPAPSGAGGPPVPEAVDIVRLPVTGAELFGRAEELRWLDEMWDSRQVRVASLVAWGGVGKSTLVNKWLERMAAGGYRGARRVFGWSFYSQGTSERVTSADLFIDQGLRFFGDPEPTLGSPWAKGERLAALVRSSRSLLVLDGLEPLQSPADGWRVQDPALGQLLRKLARPGREEAGPPAESGLCVITSRERVTDLDGFAATVAARNLEQISAEAGRALLRVRGVRGTDAELEEITRAFGSHALAVNLLASFLREVPGHPVAAAAAIPDLDVPDERGRHPRRVLEAFARRFGSGPEFELLLLLGLFDRPALAGALAAVRAAPAVAGLTDHLAGLSEAAWDKLLAKLRAVRLIAEEDRHQPGVVDAHPLVREHFGERLEQENPAAWREGHWRLSEFYSGSAELRPDTPEGLAPVFAAVHHGCKARRYDEALDLYMDRAQRGSQFYAVKSLGLFSAALQVLAGFFEVRWSQPISGLGRDRRGALLSMAGGFLTAVGRLEEAVEPMQASRVLGIEEGDRSAGALATSSLSTLYLTLGELKRALTEARYGVDLAKGSGSRKEWARALAAVGKVLHHAGNLEAAEAQFRDAEELGSEIPPLLVSGPGISYCDLLLDKRNWREVRRRAELTLEFAKRHSRLRDIGLSHLSLGAAHLLAAQEQGNDDFSAATEHLERAIEGLRRAGEVKSLPLGLLARAKLRRLSSDPGGAEEDLDEALEICSRCKLRILAADSHLGFAHLRLAEGKHNAARASLASARALIEETGYHRRDAEVFELEAALGS